MFSLNPSAPPGDVTALALQVSGPSTPPVDPPIDPPSVGAGLTPRQDEMLAFIYAKFQVLPPERAALVITSADPNMVPLGVVVRDGATPIAGATVTATMHERGMVAIDGAYEKDKSYTAVTDAQGLAVVDVFDSPRLKDLGYKGLYKVTAPGISRNVWVPAAGGVLDELPEAEPLATEPIVAP